MSLARAFKKKTLALMSEAVPEVSDTANMSASAGKRKAISALALQLELRRLKNLNSIAEKVERKRQLIEKYREEAQGWFYSGTGQSELFIHYVVWLFDTGDFQTGLRYADMAIVRGLNMPERFRRDIQTFVSDCILDAMSGDAPPHDIFAVVWERLKSGDWKIHEDIQAKYFRVVADKAFDAGDFYTAIENYAAAAKLGAPVKTRLAEARKKVKVNP